MFRLEFDLAMQSGDLKRALQTLTILSNSRRIGQGIDLSTEAMGVLSLTASQEAKAEAVFGVVKFAREFLDLIDAADATAQGDISGQALKRLAAAGAVEGALQSNELRGLSLRLATHGEMARLAVRFLHLNIQKLNCGQHGAPSPTQSISVVMYESSFCFTMTCIYTYYTTVNLWPVFKYFIKFQPLVF
jgi:hypothetical protein